MMAPNPKGITVRDCCSSLHAPPIAQPTATRVLKALQIHFAVRCIFMESSLLLELYWPNRDNSGNSSSLLVVFRLDFPKVKSEYRQVTDVCVCVYVCVVQVLWLKQQVARRRVKRGAFYLFSDPKWPRMWYLVSKIVACVGASNQLCSAGNHQCVFVLICY